MRRSRRWARLERVGAILIAFGYLLATIMPLGLALAVMGLGFLLAVVSVVGRHTRRPTQGKGTNHDDG